MEEEEEEKEEEEEEEEEEDIHHVLQAWRRLQRVSAPSLTALIGLRSTWKKNWSSKKLFKEKKNQSMN